MQATKVSDTRSTHRSQDSTPAVIAQPVALNQRIGNLALSQLLSARRLQAKLTVSTPDDVYEQEADRVADQVMRMPEPQHRSVAASAVRIQRRCEICEGSHRSRGDLIDVQRSEDTTAVAHVDSATEQAIGALQGRGSALPDAVRAYMEPRFNADFSTVRVHNDASAHQLARSLDAQAFTVGNNVVFGAGHYSPQTDAGRRLLAHELTHVVQQTAASPATHHVARAPRKGKFQADAQDVAFLQAQLLELYGLLSDAARTHLLKYSTLAIGLVTDFEGDPTLVYTVASNRVPREIKAAAEKMGITPWNVRGWTEGRGAVGAPYDAEQLLIEGARTNHFKIHVMVVSRRLCADCRPAVHEYGKGKLPVIHVPDPRASELEAAARKAEAARKAAAAQPPAPVQNTEVKNATGGSKTQPAPRTSNPAAPPEPKAVKPASQVQSTSGSSTGARAPTPMSAEAKSAAAGLRAKGTGIVASVGRIAKSVLIPVDSALKVVTAFERINQGLSKLESGVWKFTRLASAAADIRNAAEKLIKAYEGQHRLIEDMWSEAVRLDLESQSGAGTDELSDFCIDAYPVLSAQLDLSRKLRDAAIEITRNVRLGSDLLKKIFDDDAVVVAIGVAEYLYPGVSLAELFMAKQDFDEIFDIVHGLDTRLIKHVELLENDRALVEANVIPTGLAGVWAYRAR